VRGHFRGRGECLWYGWIPMQAYKSVQQLLFVPPWLTHTQTDKCHPAIVAVQAAALNRRSAMLLRFCVALLLPVAVQLSLSTEGSTSTSNGSSPSNMHML